MWSSHSAGAIPGLHWIFIAGSYPQLEVATVFMGPALRQYMNAMCKALRHHSRPSKVLLVLKPYRLVPPTAAARLHLGGCQNDGPFLGTLTIRCRMLIRIQKGTIILTTTHFCNPVARTDNVQDIGVT